MLDKIKVLCVDDERKVLNALRSLLMDEDRYEIFVAESGADGLDILEEEGDIRIVISEYQMTEMTGVDFFRQVNEKWPEAMRIVLSGYADTAEMIRAINDGQIHKFISKPWNDKELLATISTALDLQALQWENKKLRAELQKQNAQLCEVKESLEEQVVKRTEALDIRNRILQVSQGVLDVLPVVVFGIDPEDMIVHCNEYARELFPFGGIGPLGHERKDVFPYEINELIDRLEYERLPKAKIEVHNQKFRGEVRRLHDTELQGMVLVLIPES